MNHKRLISKKELGDKHPFLSNKWRLNHLIRSGQIPIVRIGKGKGTIAFDEAAIDKWIEERSRKEVIR